MGLGLGEMKCPLETKILKGERCLRYLLNTDGHFLGGQRSPERMLPGGSRAAAAVWLSMETRPYLASLPWRRQAPCLTQRSVQPWSVVWLNNNSVILNFTGRT